MRQRTVLNVFLCSGILGIFFPNAYATQVVHGYVMGIQMVPAVCSMDAQRSKKRKCLEGYALNITGLYPETAQANCSTDTSAVLSPIQTKVMARVMPDDRVRTQLWQNVGGCVPANASQYFRMMINYADKLKIPAELTGPETKIMQISTLRNHFVSLNPQLPSTAIQFECQSYRGTSLLTTVKVCYNSNGQYKQCSLNINTNCPNSFTIKGSY